MLKRKFKKIVSICLFMVLACSLALPVYAGSATSGCVRNLDDDEHGQTPATLPSNIVVNNPINNVVINQIQTQDKKEGHLVIGKEIENKKIEDIVSIPKDEIKSVTIKDDVTSIGERAFQKCLSLTSINIPNSVTSIGEYAFVQCQSLTSVTIGNGVKKIADNAFASCTGLTSIDVGKRNQYFKSIDGVLFSKDETILHKYPEGKKSTYYNIPNSVTSIGECAFDGCTGLTSVTIGNGVTSIGSSAFYECPSLTSINIPNSVTSIGEWAFHGCTGLTSVTIPNRVKKIGEWTFEGCTSLTSVTVGNSVTSIGECAFSCCTGLTSVTIGNSVTSIGEIAFEDCTGLTSITIPNSVKSIKLSAFDGCTGLTSVTIPNSVTSISVGAFIRCTGLKEIKVAPGSILKYKDIKFACGKNTQNIIITLPTLHHKKIDNLNELVGHKNGDDCLICLGPIEIGDEVTELHCSKEMYHYFHKQCFDDYLQNIEVPELKCPVCRREY